MRALGKSMLARWTDAMLLQCASNSSAGANTAADMMGLTTADMISSRQLLNEADGVMDIGSSAASGASKEADLKSVTNVLEVQLTERLRAAAGQVGGHMSVDWANCEMRSIELAWMPAGALQESGQPNTAGGQSNTGGSGAAGGWLWATPGNGGQWWPGECHSVGWDAGRYSLQRLLLRQLQVAVHDGGV
jgi:hypothetical protein